jgi:hypothetical protein
MHRHQSFRILGATLVMASAVAVSGCAPPQGSTPAMAMPFAADSTAGTSGVLGRHREPDDTARRRDLLGAACDSSGVWVRQFM